MRPCYVGAFWFAVLFVCQPAVSEAETAKEAFANGKQLVASADFEGALRAFARAARADRDNQEYFQQYAMVRRVIALRQLLDSERDAARWEYVARGLHSFYTSEGLLDEALDVDKRMYAKLNTAASATKLAETQLALHQNKEAVETLAGLAMSKQTVATRALLGLAHARQGDVENAREIADSIELADDSGPGMIYSAARLHAAVGNDERALALLTKCFQSLAPSRQPGFREHARQSAEFATLVSTEAFTEVLATESKIAESKCSGGSSCAGCPMRGKCSGSQEN